MISLRRFKQILQNIHFQDEDEATLEEWNAPRGQTGHDSLYKIRKFLNACCASFREMRSPDSNLAVDEIVRTFLV